MVTSLEFQCSSASRKFLNYCDLIDQQRQQRVSVLFSEPKIPQSEISSQSSLRGLGFSALQRAENSSMKLQQRRGSHRFRFQCSSASRKFLNGQRVRTRVRSPRVSVLFSEPKIPQLRQRLDRICGDARFSALQRAENSSIRTSTVRRAPTSRRFSALQRAENSSMPLRRQTNRRHADVSVLFSEPKIPQ